jgi:hypothetical protein
MSKTDKGVGYFFFRRFVFFAFFAFLFFAIAALLAEWVAISIQCGRESTSTVIRLLQQEKNNSDSA